VEYMLLFVQRRGEPAEAGAMKSMNAFAQELADRGKLRRGAPLAAEAQSIRVRVRDGAVLVHDGPFMETKEVVGGFWVVDVADRSEALEIAKRTPHARYGTVIVQRLSTRFAFPDAGKGTPWFFAFHGEPVVEDCDGAKLREMIAWSEELARADKLFDTAPLSQDPPPARVEVRGGEALVVDGPFAEAKEAIGGYAILRADSVEEALAIAKRYPHARWGPVEAREILFLDRVSA
jgi:hypothetical protein